MSRGDAEQRAERGVASAASVETEGEFVEVGLQMPAAQAVVDAQGPEVLARGGKGCELATEPAIRVIIPPSR